MANYILGVDVGGTKSHLAIFGTDGGKIGFYSRGGLNHEDMPGSFAQLERELGEFMRSALERHGITPEDIGYAVLGMAGVDTKEQHRIVSDIIARLGIRVFTLCNDAFLGIPAACSGGSGICAINGTGCTIAGIDARGKMLQIGGVGALSNDLGGGSQMGRAVVAAVYSSLFRRGKPTLLKDMLFDALGISDKHEMTGTLAEMLTDGELRISSFNRLMLEAGGLGDEVSLELLDSIACNYAGGVTCMLDELDFPEADETHIVFAGSVFVKAEHPVLLDMIKQKLAGMNPERRFCHTLLGQPPVAGAVAWALREYGAEPAAVRRVFEQL